MPPPDPRLPQQIDFIVAVDRLKQVFRRSRLTDDSRWENDAEHFLAPGADGGGPA